MKHPVKDWFLNQSLNHPRRTIAIALLGTAVMAFGLFSFVIDDNIMKMFPKDIESRMTWDAVREEFGSTEMIFMAFGRTGESAFNPITLASLWDISRALEEIPEVDEVISIATLNRMDGEDGFLEISDLQPARNLTPEEVGEMKTYLEKTPKMMKRVVSRHGDYLNVVIRPHIDVPHDVVRNKVVSAAEKDLSDYDVHFGGHAYLTGTIPALIRNDVNRLMRAGLLVMMIVLLLNLRSVPAVGMVMSVILLSLLAMMGFMGWVIYFTGSERFLFTLMNTSMPIILLTIANSDGVHILTKFFRELRRRKDTRQSVRATMNSLLLPVFLTSLTTTAAFLSLIFAPIEQMMGYGIGISMGIAWAWFLSSTFLPAVISLKKWKMDSKAVAHASILERVINRFGKEIIRHTKTVLFTGLVIVAIGAVGVFMVEIEVNIVKFFKPGTEIRESIEFMDREMTGTVDLQIRLEGDMKDPATLNTITGIQDYLQKNPSVSTTISIADVIEQMHRTIMDDDPAYEVIPDSREKVSNLFTLYAMSGDPDDFSALIDYDYKTALLTALMSTISTNEIIDFVDGIESYVTKNVRGELRLTITGILVIFRDLVFLIVRSSVISIVFSIFVIFLIAAFFFRRVLWGFLAVIPLTSAVILNFGLMGLFGVDLSHVTAILSSIIIGVGVDFAIHYIAQYRNISRAGVSKDSLSREVTEDVGYPIVLDAASNMSFGALLFSAFLPIEYIGGLMIFAMVSTSIGTLTLLASLAELLKNKLYGT